MSDAKIQLSEEELNLVQNAGWLLTKNKIIHTVFDLFGEVAHTIRNEVHERSLPFPPEALAMAPKISKGENYEGLPYVMLDYPRLFGKESIYAIRVFFWWGHYFSVTLHLKGSYKEQHAATLVNHLPLLAAHDFYISIGDDEWRHHFAEDNYVSLKQLSHIRAAEMLRDNRFCKLSAKISLHQWSAAKQLLAHLYGVLFQALGY